MEYKDIFNIRNSKYFLGIYRILGKTVFEKNKNFCNNFYYISVRAKNSTCPFWQQIKWIFNLLNQTYHPPA